MHKFSAFAMLGMLVLASEAMAQQAKEGTKTETTKATYLVTGLHCPPCTSTVERSLQGVKGVRSIKVDWKTKNAQVEFDEMVVPAQTIAQRIGQTPHMMGGNMRYDGWLALKVPDVKDESKAKQVKEALSKIKGVRQVATYPKQQSIGVQFGPEGKVTSRQLIDTLEEAGFEAKTL